MDLLSVLNPEQRRAVQTVEGPLLVLAGPGSGKTRVITHRIAYMMRHLSISPYSIMALTFTNRAAREMRARLETLVPNRLAPLTMGTFHAICARILRRDGPQIGIDNHFVIFDDADQQAIVKKVLRDHDLDEKRYAPRALLTHISKAKSELIGPLQYGEYASSYWEEVVLRVYRAYQEELAQRHGLDFDDLIMTATRLFRERPDVLDSYQERYRYILVDEFQDTNIAQYALLRQLAAKYHNLCVVGDEDQSVYSWRQADLRNILNFESDHPNANVIVLEQNYRSTKNILAAARSVIAVNSLRKEKHLWTANGTGQPITLYEAYSERDEARYVVSEIESLVARGVCQPSECAVMYRTNAQSRALEEAFVLGRMPYQLVGGTRFYERKEVKDVLAFLRFAFNPYDDASLQRMLAVSGHGIGAKTVQGLEQLSAKFALPLFGVLVLLKHGPEAPGDYLPGLQPVKLPANFKSPFTTRAEQILAGWTALPEKVLEAAQRLEVPELLELVLRESGLTEQILDGSEEGQERWENVRELASVAADYAGIDPQTGLEAFLETAALASDQDEHREEKNAVTLITLHAAKGLEFKAVFLAGAEEGLCPHSRSADDPKQMEEERRLFYVGMTRAKERLYILYAFRRTLYGGSQPGLPSRFLADIPEELMGTIAQTSTATLAPATPTKSASRPHPQATTPVPDRIAFAAGPLLQPGDRVRHPSFGEGIVVGSKANKTDVEVSVAFPSLGVKRLSLSFAKLERL
ncbi:MAG: UvrD-helicase domain-containing protein [Chloroflexota bacterium]